MTVRYLAFAIDSQGGDCSLDDLVFETVDNGVKASFPTSSVCRANRFKIPNVDGIYQAAQYHIHIGTEHEFEGNSYDLELHVVHALVSGSGSSIFPDGVGGTNQFAVYGFAIEAGGPANAEFQQLLDKWVTAQNTAVANCSTRRKLGETKEVVEESATTSTDKNNSYLRQE